MNACLSARRPTKEQLGALLLLMVAAVSLPVLIAWENSINALGMDAYRLNERMCTV